MFFRYILRRGIAGSFDNSVCRLSFWLCHMSCGIPVPWLVIELRPLAVRVQSPNHWTATLLSFKEHWYYLPQWLYQFSFHQRCSRISFSSQPHQHLFFVVFLMKPIWHMWGDTLLRIWIAFLWWLTVLDIFSCACWPFVYLHWKNVYSSLLPIFRSTWIFFNVFELYEVSIYFRY